jgi:galactonate dehydratase
MTLKITGVNVHLLERYLYAEVQTDAGISGIGESGAWGYLESTAARSRSSRAT